MYFIRTICILQLYFGLKNWKKKALFPPPPKLKKKKKRYHQKCPKKISTSHQSLGGHGGSLRKTEPEAFVARIFFGMTIFIGDKPWCFCSYIHTLFFSFFLYLITGLSLFSLEGKKNLEWPGLVVPPPHCGGRSGAVVSAPGGSRQLDFSAPRKTDLVVNQKTNGFDKFLFLVSNKILSRHLYQLFPLRFVCTWRRMAASPDG